MTTVLIIGSGPNAVQATEWTKADWDHVVVINNAWQVRPDWDVLICPDDFQPHKRPKNLAADQKIIGSSIYVPHQNAYGGFVYAGGTMAFTAGYWALSALKPSVIAMIGCDMIYAAQGPTHFYGTGTADPLRSDVTLRSLPAKSARLMALAARSGCAMVNLSNDQSVLTFPRAQASTAAAHAPLQHDARAVAAALQKEKDLGYYVPSGKYWKEESRFDPIEIDALDAMWLATVQPLQ